MLQFFLTKQGLTDLESRTYIVTVTPIKVHHAGTNLYNK